MIVHETQLRVRYAETDQMGVVYHGHYLAYFEVSRAEAIRAMGYTYADMERDGILMPVVEVHVQYLRPARYDDLLTLRATMEERPGRRCIMKTEVFHENGKKLVEGKVTLAFVDVRTGKSVDAPETFLNLLEAHWTES